MKFTDRKKIICIFTLGAIFAIVLVFNNGLILKIGNNETTKSKLIYLYNETTPPSTNLFFTPEYNNGTTDFVSNHTQFSLDLQSKKFSVYKKIYSFFLIFFRLQFITLFVALYKYL